MNFTSWKQLTEDVIAWSIELPRNFDLIVGIPRSGMVPASILALHRNIPLTDVDSFSSGSIFRGGLRDQRTDIKNVLVIDDSCLSGRSLSEAAKKLEKMEKKFNIKYGTVYMKPKLKNVGWLYFKTLPIPRIFEWNMFHSYWAQRSCMDIDGILCRDPTLLENDDGKNYLNFIRTVEPKHIPTVQINTLVTSRLEKYRTETVKWLLRQRIGFKNLVMHQAETKLQRQSANNHAKCKAKAYIASKLVIFFESSDKQAYDINRLSGRPVICTDTMKLYNE